METRDSLVREGARKEENGHHSTGEGPALQSTSSRTRSGSGNAGEILDTAVALDNGSGRPHMGLAATSQERCAHEKPTFAFSPKMSKAGLGAIPLLSTSCPSAASADSAATGILRQECDEQPEGLPNDCAVKETTQHLQEVNFSLLATRKQDREGVRSPARQPHTSCERGSSPASADSLCEGRDAGTPCSPSKETEIRSGEADASVAVSDRRSNSHCSQCGGMGLQLGCDNCGQSLHPARLEQELPSSGSTSKWACLSSQSMNGHICGQQPQNVQGAVQEGVVEKGRCCENDAVGILVEGEETSGGKGSCGGGADDAHVIEATRVGDNDTEPLQETNGASLPHETMCAEGCSTVEKKEYMASKKRHAAVALSPKAAVNHASPRSASPSPSHYSRKKRRCDSEAGSTSRCKVNIGPRHQVPAVPPFFLDSTCAWDGKAETLSDFQGLYANDTDDTARLVYSPYAMQRVYMKRLAEGAGDKIIKNAEEMNSFIQCVAQNWTSKSGWQPFSPEYAYKLLHFAGYDPHRAIRIMKDPNFCFTAICDPPQRRYDNKWRPNDRRGQIGTLPYPSPLTLRAYLSKRNQHAAAPFHRGAST
uniref:ELM2 domain-containing protein n=1 Tax=Toxoplasma gondii (strain ATCC 50861 / VEG) TaxID=432359 RepID=A0A0F7V2F8_TOXGV|nr:TPA: hypothetical protein BN1205_022990 [Toxoplasma gondii VEG]